MRTDLAEQRPENFLREIEVAAIARAVRRDMRLVLPEPRRRREQWQGRRDAAVIDELRLARDEPGVAGDEAGA